MADISNVWAVAVCSVDHKPTQGIRYTWVYKLNRSLLFDPFLPFRPLFACLIHRVLCRFKREYGRVCILATLKPFLDRH